MGNFKLKMDTNNENTMRVVLFVSRNKDNRDIKNFKERRETFVISSINERLSEKFEAFVKRGVKGEQSRFYISVNTRDKEKVHKELIHFLIDNPNFNLCNLDSKVAAIAARKENAKTHEWLFDFDINDYFKVIEFCHDIFNIEPDLEKTVFKTPNGYAIIVNRGFDTRKLLKKWNNNVTLKRDDLLCFAWRKNV